MPRKDLSEEERKARDIEKRKLQKERLAAAKQRESRELQYIFDYVLFLGYRRSSDEWALWNSHGYHGTMVGCAAMLILEV